ncbi:MAG: four helix bundle protein [Candidatus Mcinerneyibacterium aminivorans]|uniref:Four helix bundle protein n=1 Tax=Candidatus Mcinerneyibacterium aminivorans TaxID=2703815 RepID=A0A5D0MEY3_9BACT|nr:MAG: four helix bundle protein [Candidatus Mcinerneyibacterium aminivorans]
MEKEYLKDFDDFKEMSAWKISMNVSEKVFDITKKLPKKEDYGLTSQIRRSTNSIGANIAEGFGRSHKMDKVQYYTYSISSAYETLHHLRYGRKIGYFENSDVESISNKIKQIIFELNKLNKSIKNYWE